MLLLFQQVAWANRTNVHWAGLALAIVLAFALLLLPRRWAPFSLLLLTVFIPAGQRLVVFSLDFSFLRILVLFGWMRVILRGELGGFRLHLIDLVLLASTVVGLIAYTFSRGTTDALVFKLGTAFDAAGLYFLFRFLVRTWEDLEHLGTILAMVVLPVSLAFLIERSTGRNLFSFLGGVPELTEVREGRLRCQGAFGHPILAGCFWAGALPLMGACFWVPRRKFLAGVGTLAALTIVFLTASSTPVFAVGMAALGAFSFYFRRHLALIRWILLGGAVSLHLVMNNPIWHLLARVNVVGGSTGWHRFYLIDEAVNRVDEWWLIGTPSTMHWGRGLGDITNQFVLEAVQGGLLGLVLFLTLGVLGFRAVGPLWRRAAPVKARVALAWALGTSLLVQWSSFLGVAYFDQTGILWQLTLASIASLSVGADVVDSRLQGSLLVRGQVPSIQSA